MEAKTFFFDIKLLQKFFLILLKQNFLNFEHFQKV